MLRTGPQQSSPMPFLPWGATWGATALLVSGQDFCWCNFLFQLNFYSQQKNTASIPCQWTLSCRWIRFIIRISRVKSHISQTLSKGPSIVSEVAQIKESTCLLTNDCSHLLHQHSIKGRCPWWTRWKWSWATRIRTIGAVGRHRGVNAIGTPIIPTGWLSPRLRITLKFNSLPPENRLKLKRRGLSSNVSIFQGLRCVELRESNDHQ